MEPQSLLNGATLIQMRGTDPLMRGTDQVFAGDIDESMSFHSLPASGHVWTKELYRVFTRSTQGKKILIYLAINMMATILHLYIVMGFCTILAVLFAWCHVSNSMSMTALAYMTVFDISYLLTAAVSVWTYRNKSSVLYSFGYERFEVLAVFTSTMLAQLGSFFIFKESIERVFEPHHIHIGRLPPGSVLAMLSHMLVIYSIENIPFNHVIQASSSSWLQEHVTDISESICHVIPGLSKLLLPRINPFTLLGVASSSAVLATYVAVDMKNYQGADVTAAVCIGVFTIGTMYPMASYTGKILLQTTPAHMIGQLDKCLREACTLDGVLEFRNEHFWTLGFGKMAGSVHVRVRRDANYQLVLAHVYNRLSSLISNLTVQIFKDDWSRSTAYQIIQNTSMNPISPLRPQQRPFSTGPLGHEAMPGGSSLKPWTSTPLQSPLTGV